jgi:hypothetical protein
MILINRLNKKSHKLPFMAFSQTDYFVIPKHIAGNEGMEVHLIRVGGDHKGNTTKYGRTIIYSIPRSGH